ncbi:MULTISPECIES: p pilus assembly chaperone [Pseudomonas]|uniref:Molecular chaperone n=1 Tax=Pseudomonas poae TaxID=200451 RepID=A0AAP2S065_9PSED|nr:MULTISPECIES: p pilus assembly chaperone [Pseudomonas]AGE24567.1 p pilus assembly chaperone [Pseudomonas poae RE*1-1-14]MCF5655088.1 molecular chaperone [Pseudomonas poae]MCF5776316.1 molecular chaperone [Pseudomonas poae]NMZ51252.1 molecular chaperone [Pseudomonas poae]CRM46407.1 putative fimbrial protein TcfA [Pseudomonas sp. 25 E 4]
MKCFLTLCAALLLAQVAHAGPQINVGVVYDYLEAGKSTYMKRVFNGGTSTAFVKVNILEMVYDADGSYREVPVKTSADISARDGLMASPARLIVPANGTQGTRLLFMGNRDRERYFRVRFVPVVPQTEDEFAISEEERQDYKDSLAAGVRVLAGYGTVFFVRPTHTRFDTQVQDDTTRYALHNQGNSVVVVDEFKDCAVGNPQDCRPTIKHHIMAGRSFTFDKQPGRVYRFNLIEGSAKKTIEIEG